MRRSDTSALAWGSIVLLACALTGCAPAADDEPNLSTGTPSSSDAPEQSAAPTLDPDGTAENNKAFFDAVNERVARDNPDALGMDFIDALTDAGFDRSAMEATEDYSTVGNRAESIQFSVRWNDNCLIGQYGDSVDGYHSVIMPVLDAGTCLIGNTRAID